MKGFRIAINMAGAISAGAYTAGVLDFLTEALDAWHKAKADGAEVPQHEVMIEGFSGASAGGLCAALSALLLQDDFEHVADATKRGTTNRFYESWVNKTDIRELLKTRDLVAKGGERPGPLVSLLDSTLLDELAVYGATRGPAPAVPRPYVSPDLTVFLSLTNLRGVLYSLNGLSPGGVEETTSFFGDRIQFQTVRPDSKRPLHQAAYPVDLTVPQGDFELLGNAAMATGAFPMFLAPRVLKRRHSDYTPPLWESHGTAKDDAAPVEPSFPPGMADPFETLNVDGGITNNDPYNYAHDYLAALDPAREDHQLERDPCKADRAVVSIAPFPTMASYAVDYDPRQNAGVLRVMARLFQALVSQSRFYGESLSHLMRGTTFCHFMVAPSDHELVEELKHEAVHHKPIPKALQCAALGAFGGFFERGFRAHDYELGRRNCQKFLLDHFVFPAENVVMKEALAGMDMGVRARVVDEYRRSTPKGPDGEPMEYAANACAASRRVWLPVIPLCTPELRVPIAPVPRYKMKDRDLDEVVRLVAARFEAVAQRTIRVIHSRALRWSLRPAPWFISKLGRASVKQMLVKGLGDSYEAGE
jgi:predicted acylesterase/phospholipase RssA